MNEGQKRLLLIITLIPLFVIGCYTKATNISSTSELQQATAQESDSIIFGRIKWLEKGEEKKIGKGVFSMSVTPHLMRMEDKARIFGEVSEDGNFVWSLKKGSYFFHKMAYRDPWSGNYFVVPKVAFNVPENGKVYYVGTLIAEFIPKRDFIGGLSGKVKFTVVDEENNYYLDFAKKFNINSNDINKSLMVHDQRLPRSVETTESYNLAISIMNAILFGISQ